MWCDNYLSSAALDLRRRENVALCTTLALP